MARNIPYQKDNSTGGLHQAEAPHVDQIVSEVGLVLEKRVLRQLALKLFQGVQTKASENEVEQKETYGRGVCQPEDAENVQRPGGVAAE